MRFDYVYQRICRWNAASNCCNGCVKCKDTAAVIVTVVLTELIYNDHSIPADFDIFMLIKCNELCNLYLANHSMHKFRWSAVRLKPLFQLKSKMKMLLTFLGLWWQCLIGYLKWKYRMGSPICKD